ncbi:hypothetical protein LTR62_001348 [Meristemomyces frigidus]|uniref:N-acetyltransferase domain-containing protein n=1 Tax=Meristemomyces frigidus TaxID=1508187 RepID=A0AAN7YBN3_9PEZI|nr:hypothetical protein LTR62_001348 [Meristemomyces frigidus]
MSEHFTIELAHVDDVPALMDIVIPCFAHIPVEQLFGNVDTPEGRGAAGKRHLRAWGDHAAESTQHPAIKCVHTDPDTGQGTIVGFAEWFVYEIPGPIEKYDGGHYLIRGAWLSEENGERAKAQSWMKPVYDARKKWLGGRRHAVLMYMCVEKTWRRRGAATMSIQWGLDRCRELGIPAWLEASEDGEPGYRRCGFEEVEKVEMDFDGEKGVFPAMMWWPPGYAEADKRPVLT